MEAVPDVRAQLSINCGSLFGGTPSPYPSKVQQNVNINQRLAYTPWIVLKTSKTEICNYVSINYVNILLTSIYSEIAKKTKETQDYVDYMFIAIFNWLVQQENISEYKLSKLDKCEAATEFLGEFSIVNYAQRSEDIAKPNTV